MKSSSTLDGASSCSLKIECQNVKLSNAERKRGYSQPNKAITLRGIDLSSSFSSAAERILCWVSAWNASTQYTSVTRASQNAWEARARLSNDSQIFPLRRKTELRVWNRCSAACHFCSKLRIVQQACRLGGSYALKLFSVQRSAKRRDCLLSYS